MKTYYDVGNATASIEELPSGHFRTIVLHGGEEWDSVFDNELSALREILSYAEVDDDWFEEELRECEAKRRP